MILTFLFSFDTDAVAQNRILYWGTTGDDVIKVQVKLKRWDF